MINTDILRYYDCPWICGRVKYPVLVVNRGQIIDSNLFIVGADRAGVAGRALVFESAAGNDSPVSTLDSDRAGLFVDTLFGRDRAVELAFGFTECRRCLRRQILAGINPLCTASAKTVAYFSVA